MPQRVMILLVGTLASALALIARLAGLFGNWDAQLLASLQLPAGHATLPLWVEVICALLFAFGTAIVGMQVAESKFRSGLILAILLQPFSALAVGALAGCWVSPFSWLTSIIAALLGVAVWRFSSAGRREREVRTVFGRHLSEGSLAKLLKNPDALTPKTAQAVIVSARHVGANWNQVEQAAAWLLASGAWLEVQTGNRLLAVWNLPLQSADPAETAVAAILGLTDEWQIGVATGEVTGEIPASTSQWQMHGTAFEKADSLYQANAKFGSRILLDLATADLVRDSVVLRPVDFLVLPATEIGVEVFEPLGLTTTASEQIISQRDRFWEAVIFFRQKRFAEAREAFRKSGDDAVVRHYVHRLEELT